MTLDSKVDGITYYEPNSDRKGLYIPYCGFFAHPGILDVGKSEVCESRECRHYQKLYIKWNEVRNEISNKSN